MDISIENWWAALLLLLLLVLVVLLLLLAVVVVAVAVVVIAFRGAATAAATDDDARTGGSRGRAPSADSRDYAAAGVEFCSCADETTCGGREKAESECRVACVGLLLFLLLLLLSFVGTPALSVFMHGHYVFQIKTQISTGVR